MRINVYVLAIERKLADERRKRRGEQRGAIASRAHK